MPFRKPLIELWPKYLALPGRRFMGVSFHCPNEVDTDHFRAHGPHRVELWFLYPDDCGDPNLDASIRLYHHLGDLEVLKFFSVYDVSGRPLECANHWEGYLVEGVVYDASGLRSY